jgi:carboxymethylenebutenolidase
MGQTITIPGQDGAFSGYLATPASGSGPAIVVIQEIFGINAVMREMADRLAVQGFFALAPDLFWRLEPNVELTDKTDAEWQKAFALMNRFDIDAGVRDIQATITTLRSLTGVTGKVGAVGYCLGGLLAFLTATRTDADAAVGYYGVNIQNYLAEAARIKKPLMLHIAEKDSFSTLEAREQLLAGLMDNPLATLHVYDGADHAFARPGGKNWDASAAATANARTDLFFREHLS